MLCTLCGIMVISGIVASFHGRLLERLKEILEEKDKDKL